MTKGSRQLKQTFEYFSNMDWESWEPDDIEPHKEFMLTIWEFQKTRNHDNKSLLTTLKRLMPAARASFQRWTGSCIALHEDANGLLAWW